MDGAAVMDAHSWDGPPDYFLPSLQGAKLLICTGVVWGFCCVLRRFHRGFNGLIFCLGDYEPINSPNSISFQAMHLFLVAPID